MDAIRQWLADNYANIQTIGTWILIIAGLIFVIWKLIQAIRSFQQGNTSEGLKHIAFGILIAAIAFSGIAIMYGFADAILKDTTFLPKGTPPPLQ